MRFLFVFFVMLAAATAAWAYVPPAERMLEQWTAAYAKVPNVVFTGTLEAGAESYPFEARSTEESFTYLQNGRPVTDATSRFVFGMLTRPAKALQTLRNRGLDTGKTGFARVGQQIAWTLGAAGEGQPGSQIWLNRDTLAPLLVVYAPPGEAEIRIVFSGYEKSPSKLFPTQIDVTFGGGTTRHYHIEKLTQPR